MLDKLPEQTVGLACESMTIDILKIEEELKNYDTASRKWILGQPTRPTDVTQDERLDVDKLLLLCSFAKGTVKPFQYVFDDIESDPRHMMVAMDRMLRALDAWTLASDEKREDKKTQKEAKRRERMTGESKTKIL